jgi:hypothetical protein
VLVINTCNHDVDTDEGRVLVPGERAEITDSERHRQLVADGLLTDLTDRPEYNPAPAPLPDVDDGAVPAVPDDAPDAPAAPATNRSRRQRGAATEEN